MATWLLAVGVPQARAAPTEDDVPPPQLRQRLEDTYTACIRTLYAVRATSQRIFALKVSVLMSSGGGIYSWVLLTSLVYLWIKKCIVDFLVPLESGGGGSEGWVCFWFSNSRSS